MTTDDIAKFLTGHPGDYDADDQYSIAEAANIIELEDASAAGHGTVEEAMNACQFFLTDLLDGLIIKSVRAFDEATTGS